jgi:predicted ATPase
LVTSRQLLRLSGEQEYPVPPLGEREAIRLFQARAAGEAAATTAAEICRRLDCLPLAVELAAARTKALSAEQILDRLGHRLALLNRGLRDAPGRQQTLRATIEWSSELLTNDERHLFARIAVFDGGCTLEAAEQIAEAELDTLQSLVEKNLLRYSEERFWMLETIREYAVEMLDTFEERDELADRHASFFAEVIAEADRLLHGPDEKEMRRRLAPDTANVLAATRWAYKRKNAELLLQLARGGEALSLPVAGQIPFMEAALSWWRGPTTPLLAEGYWSAGAVHFLLHEYEVARARLEVGVSLYRELGDAEGEAMALRMLGVVLAELGDVDGARATLNRALDLVGQAGSTRSYQILHHLGELEAMQGQPERGIEYLRRAVEIARREGDLAHAANVLHGLGDAHLALHDLTEAHRCYTEALTISFEFKQPRGCLYCLRGLAAVAALQRQPERAGFLWGAADTIERQSGYTLLARTYEQYKAAVDNATGTNFDAAAERGRALTLERAIAYASQRGGEDNRSNGRERTPEHRV